MKQYLLSSQTEGEILNYIYDNKIYNDYKLLKNISNKLFLQKKFKKTIDTRDTLIDLGCGFGSSFYLYKLIKKKVTLVDLRGDFLKFAKKILTNNISASLNTKKVNILNIKNYFKYDVVLCLRVLNSFNINDQKKMITKLTKFSKNTIIIEVMKKYSLVNFIFFLSKFKFFRIIFKTISIFFILFCKVILKKIFNFSYLWKTYFLLKSDISTINERPKRIVMNIDDYIKIFNALNFKIIEKIDNSSCKILIFRKFSNN